MSSQHTQSPQEIESEIERTRSHMDDTIDAIQAKFSTGQLVDQALGYLRQTRHGPAEFATNLGNTAKHNPVPVTLTGLGIGWLMMSSNRPSTRTSQPAKASPGAGDGSDDSGMRDKMSGAASHAKHVAGSSRDRAGRVAHGTQEQIGRISHGARSSFNSVSHGTASAGRYGVDFMREQPLVAGALGIAFGAALGAVLGPSRLEDEVMGEAGDDAREAAAETAERQFDKAESAIRSSGDESAQNDPDAGSGRHAGEADRKQATSKSAAAPSSSISPNQDRPDYRF